jgi:hypothetical protein
MTVCAGPAFQEHGFFNNKIVLSQVSSYAEEIFTKEDNF